MKQFCLFIFLLAILENCDSIYINTESNSIKDINKQIEYKAFEFQINNNISSEFSFAKGDLFDGGIKSLIIHDNYCFFVDEIHRNIKRINLIDGSKTISKTLLNSTGKSLNDVTIHNNLLYVSSFQNKIYVLDDELNLVKTIELHLQGNNGIFFTGTKDDNMLLHISVLDTLIEIDTTGKEINRQKVTPYNNTGTSVTTTRVFSGKIVIDTVITDTLDKKLYYYTYYNKNDDSYLREKKYKIIQKGENDFFVNDNFEIKLTAPYTHMENTDINFINDIDFNNYYLIILEILPPKYVIHVYSIK